MAPSKAILNALKTSYSQFVRMRDASETLLKDVLFITSITGLLYSCYHAGFSNTVKGIMHYSNKYLNFFKNIYASATEARLEAKGMKQRPLANQNIPLEQLNNLNRVVNLYENNESTRGNPCLPYYGAVRVAGSSRISPI